MKKKWIIPILLISLLALIPLAVVLAGATIDYGTVPGNPPAGQVNWIAWLVKNVGYTPPGEDVTTPAGAPYEVMTEDNTNSDLGTDNGYQDDGFGNRYWLLQVENFTTLPPNHGDAVRMVFGGLGLSSPNTWNYTFNWNQLEDPTLHTSLTDGTDEPCPSIVSRGTQGGNYVVNFSGLTGGTYYYHVYRATQPSGADNGASAGRFQYRGTVTVTDGSGTFSEAIPVGWPDAWYIIVRAASATGLPVACHSEEAQPTAVTIVGFEAQAGLRGIQLSWETMLQFDLVGFNVYRSELPDTLGSKVNTSLVPVKLGQDPLSGEHYDYFDASAQAGVVYYYTLEAVYTQSNPTKTEQQRGYYMNLYLPQVISQSRR